MRLDPVPEGQDVDDSIVMRPPEVVTPVRLSDEELERAKVIARRVKLRAAIVKLGIDEEEFFKAPDITEILEQSAGGLKTVLAAMRFSTHPSVERFLEGYDKASDEQRKIVPWQAWAMLAGVDIRELLGAIVLALREHSVNLVKVIAITSHPETVRARVAAAMMPSGTSDRNSLDTALKFLPAKQGATFISMPGGTLVTNKDELKDADPQELFPDLSETQRLIGP